MAGVAERHAERDEEHEGSVAFLVTKPVNLAWLDREIAEAHGWDEPSGLTTEGPGTEASEEDPVVVWVHHPDTRANLVTRVVESHDRGLPGNDLTALREKALADEPLDDIEVQQALRALLRRAR